MIINFVFSSDADDDDISVIIESEFYQETFRVQGSLLSSLSPVFKAMLSLPLAEAKTRIINMNDLDPRYYLEIVVWPIFNKTFIDLLKH